MQQLTEKHAYYPTYVEKLILYFTPSGSIIIKAGNTYMNATSADVIALVESRIAQHELVSTLFNRTQEGTKE